MMADISITERFGAEPLRCDDCGGEHPHHATYCKRLSPEEARQARERRCHEQFRIAEERAARAERALAHCQTALKAAERERDEARQAADELSEAARAVMVDACMRGFSMVRAHFDAWREGDRGLGHVADDPDVFLALQATHLGFQALARALEKGPGHT